MPDSYPALIELISRLEGKDRKTCELALYCLNKADKREAKLRAELEKLRAALRLIFSCGVQQEDVLSNKYKIVIPEYVLSEVEGLMNEAMGKYDK